MCFFFSPREIIYFCHSSCHPSIGALSILKSSFSLAFLALKLTMPGSPSHSVVSMLLPSLGMAWSYLSLSLSQASMNPCIIFSPCYPSWTWGFVFLHWLPCWVSSGSMLEKSALMPALAKCSLSIVSRSWSPQYFWRWPLTASLPYVMHWDMLQS